MYGIFNYMSVIYGINVSKYAIHGSSGICSHANFLLWIFGGPFPVKWRLPVGGAFTFAAVGKVVPSSPNSQANWDLHCAINAPCQVTGKYGKYCYEDV